MRRSPPFAGRRPRLPVFSPVIGTGAPDQDGTIAPAADGPDVATLIDLAATLHAAAPAPYGFDAPYGVGVSGTSDIETAHFNPHEHYVGPTGAAVVPSNPGPRILYVSHRRPERGHARMPTVIRGISLSTQ